MEDERRLGDRRARPTRVSKVAVSAVQKLNAFSFQVRKTEDERRLGEMRAHMQLVEAINYMQTLEDEVTVYLSSHFWRPRYLFGSKIDAFLLEIQLVNLWIVGHLMRVQRRLGEMPRAAGRGDELHAYSRRRGLPSGDTTPCRMTKCGKFDPVIPHGFVPPDFLHGVVSPDARTPL